MPNDKNQDRLTNDADWESNRPEWYFKFHLDGGGFRRPQNDDDDDDESWFTIFRRFSLLGIPFAAVWAICQLSNVAVSQGQNLGSNGLIASIVGTVVILVICVLALTIYYKTHGKNSKEP